MHIQIPEVGDLQINTIILDLNGTLTVGGKVVDGVKERLAKLREKGLRLIFFSGDTRGNANELAELLGIEFIKAGKGEDKANEARKLDPETCATIGNGLIDLKLLQTVKLGIITLQAEGVHSKVLLECDIVVPTINDALDLFLDVERLIATLRA